MNDTALHVKSHVARDLLQSAAFFKREWLAVLEYVENGLQYVDPGVAPIVRVTVDTRDKRITVRDNGRGMSWNDLQNFFLMHGENLDRKQGRPGRGYFGTGKSAAFGIAQVLRVTTVQAGKRSKVELRRAEIEAISSGAPIPVKMLEKEISTIEPNGTLIEIEDIYLKSLDQSQIIKYIERHIAHRPYATVYVNNHQCEYIEPPVAKTYKFVPIDEPFRTALGHAELLIKVAKAPLEEALQGIAIVSEGIWYETTLAGGERKEMSQFIFGQLDVPALARDSSPIPAFDQSRSMQLNKSNELVQRIYAFIGLHVEDVRKGLVEEEHKRRASEEAKRLAQEAKEIARIINIDFDAYRAKLARMASHVAGGKDNLPEALMPEGGSIILEPGSEIPAREADDGSDIGGGRKNDGGSGEEPPDLGHPLEPADAAEAEDRAKETRRSTKPRPRGGFNVEFRNMGEIEDRARYERKTRTIYVNLDHPQLARAVAGVGTENLTFRRLAYEVAFAEYSIALASEMAQAGHFADMTEPLTEMRQTLNRIARAAADLY